MKKSRLTAIGSALFAGSLLLTACGGGNGKTTNVADTKSPAAVATSPTYTDSPSTSPTTTNTASPIPSDSPSPTTSTRTSSSVKAAADKSYPRTKEGMPYVDNGLNGIKFNLQVCLKSNESLWAFDATTDNPRAWIYFDSPGTGNDIGPIATQPGSIDWLNQPVGDAGTTVTDTTLFVIANGNCAATLASWHPNADNDLRTQRNGLPNIGCHVVASVDVLVSQP